MTVQARLNTDTTKLLKSGFALVKENETLKQDAGRSGNLAPYTLLSYDATNAKWVPFTDETATDGTEFPTGVYVGTDALTEAAIKAGDIVGIPVLVGAACTIDSAKLVIENSKTLATKIATLNISVEQCIRWAGIFVESTIDIDGYENV